MLDTGTAPVRVEAIEFKSPLQGDEYYIQLVASSNPDKLQKISVELPHWQKLATTEQKMSI